MTWSYDDENQKLNVSWGTKSESFQIEHYISLTFYGYEVDALIAELERAGLVKKVVKDDRTE